MILPFESFLLERRQRGNLYHYTSVMGLFNILTNNVLLMNGGGGVSFTRNQNFHQVRRMIGSVACRLVVDGDRLSDRYQVKPYNYFKNSIKGNLSSTESEERVQSDITDIHKYVLSVDLYEPLIRNFHINNICYESTDFKEHMGDFTDTTSVDELMGCATSETIELLKSYFESQFSITFTIQTGSTNKVQPLNI